MNIERFPRNGINLYLNEYLLLNFKRYITDTIREQKNNTITTPPIISVRILEGYVAIPTKLKTNMRELRPKE